MAWLTGYAYRKPIVIAHNASATRRIKVSIVESVGDDVDGDSPTIYLDDLALNYPYDIRLTTDDGTTLLDFWRQEYDATDGTWWFEVPCINGNTTVYLYYGDADATDVSSITNTFLFADHFDGTITDKWTVYGSVSNADSICHIIGELTTSYITGKSSYEYGRLLFRGKVPQSVGGYVAYLLWGTDTAGVGRLDITSAAGATNNTIYTYHDGVTDSTAMAVNIEADYHDFIYTWTNAAQKYYLDGVLKATHTKNPHDAKAPAFYAFKFVTNARHDVYLDWLAIDDTWTATEPTFTWGVLEEAPVAVSDTSQLIWNIRTPVSDTSIELWNVRTSVSDSIQTIWKVIGAISNSVQVIWNVHVGVPVSDTFQLVWNTRAVIPDTIRALWNILTPVSDTLQQVWNVRLLSGSDAIKLVWNIKATLSDIIKVIWNTESFRARIGRIGTPVSILEIPLKKERLKTKHPKGSVAALAARRLNIRRARMSRSVNKQLNRLRRKAGG